MRNKIKEILHTFCYITTGITMAHAVYIGIFWGTTEISTKAFGDILLVAFLCTLGNLIYPEKEPGKKELIIRMIIHYVYINVVVFGFGIALGWFRLDNLTMILVLLLLIAAIFFGIWGVFYFQGKKEANDLNERLKAYQEEE